MDKIIRERERERGQTDGRTCLTSHRSTHSAPTDSSVCTGGHWSLGMES